MLQYLQARQRMEIISRLSESNCGVGRDDDDGGDASGRETRRVKMRGGVDTLTQSTYVAHTYATVVTRDAHSNTRAGRDIQRVTNQPTNQPRSLPSQLRDSPRYSKPRLNKAAFKSKANHLHACYLLM